MILKQAHSKLQAYEKIKIFDINRKVNPKGRLKKNYYNFTSGLLSNKVKKELLGGALNVLNYYHIFIETFFINYILLTYFACKIKP